MKLITLSKISKIYFFNYHLTCYHKILFFRNNVSLLSNKQNKHCFAITFTKHFCLFYYTVPDSVSHKDLQVPVKLSVKDLAGQFVGRVHYLSVHRM